MADNTTIEAVVSAGEDIATDDIGGIKHQRVKVQYGVDGAATDVSDTNPLPIDDAGGSLTVDGTVTADAGTGPWPVTDNGGSLTIDGTVGISGTVDTELPTAAALADNTANPTTPGVSAFGMAYDGTTWDRVRGDSANGVLVNLGTNNDVTVSGVATASNQLPDGHAVTVDNAAGASAVNIQDGGNSLTIDGTVTANAGTGVFSVDDNAGSLTIDHSTLAVVGGGTEAAAMRVTLANNSTGLVSVDDNGGSLTIDGTVTANAGTGTFTVDLGANNDLQGQVAHDAAVANNPVIVAGAAQDSDDTAPPNRVSTEGDTTRLATDFDGSVHVLPHGPQIWDYHLDTSSAQTDASVHAAPGAGLSLYVTDIVFSSNAATAINLFFEEAATTVLGPFYLEAVAGRGMTLSFRTPKKITANTALTLTTSAAIAHSVEVMGYTTQG